MRKPVSFLHVPTVILSPAKHGKYLPYWNIPLQLPSLLRCSPSADSTESIDLGALLSMSLLLSSLQMRATYCIQSLSSKLLVTGNTGGFSHRAVVGLRLGILELLLCRCTSIIFKIFFQFQKFTVILFPSHPKQICIHLI